MIEIDELLQQETWRFWDQSLSGKSRSALESFAADDLTLPFSRTRPVTSNSTNLGS